MEEINRSETITNRNEWVDSEGRFHRRVVIETIIVPAKVQDNKPNPTINFGIPKEFIDNFPGFWNSMKVQEPKNFFGNPTDKPLIDIKALMEKGKKFLEQSGMKLEDLFKSEDDKKESAEELVKEAKKDDKPKPQESSKPLKVVYRKEPKPLKTEETVKSKEVKKDAKSKKTSKESQESRRR